MSANFRICYCICHLYPVPRKQCICDCNTPLMFTVTENETSKDSIDMPICKHLVPIKFECKKCAEEKMSPMAKQIHDLTKDVNDLKNHKDCQIDENRKSSRRIDELEKQLAFCNQAYKDLLTFKKTAFRNYEKTPHKCPVCDGKKHTKEEVNHQTLKFELCNVCDGKGIVWG